MSHRGGGGAKSQGSKTEKKGEGKGRETTPLVTTEIVPGRLNESEWSLLLDRDEGQDFAAEVVAEVVDTVISITYDSYLDIAVIPYTVQHFTSLLEEIVEAQFPICDEGEPILPSPEIDVVISHPEFPNYQSAEEEDHHHHRQMAVSDDNPDIPTAAAAEAEMEPLEIAVMDTTEENVPHKNEVDDGDVIDAEAEDPSSSERDVGAVSAPSGSCAISRVPEAVDSISVEALIVGDASWMEDEEPVCGITDSWAQGSVPVQKTGQGSRPLSRISVILEGEEAGINEGTQEAAETERSVGTPLGQDSKMDQDELLGAEAPSSTVPVDEQAKKCPWEKGAKKGITVKKKKKTPDTSLATDGAEGMKAPIDAAFLSSTTSILSLEAPLLPRYSGAIARTQYGRPPGLKDIAFDELGNVTRVSRIDPDKMPSHHVKTKCQLPSSEDTTHLKRRYNRQYKKPGHLPSLPASSKLLPTPPSIPPMPTIDDIVFPLATTSHSGITPSDSFDEAGLTMIDKIEVSPGVIVRDNDRIKIGPEIPSPDTTAFTRLSDTRSSMQPIKTHLPSAMAIKDMVERRTPTLRPYHEKPLYTQYGRAK